MNKISLIGALILICISLTGKRGRVIALGLAWMLVFPVFKPLGLRSAVYPPELVIAFVLVPWLWVKRTEDIPEAPRWYGWNLSLPIVWAVIVTTMGYIHIGLYEQIPYRIPMAGLRIAAVVLSFMIPASVPLDEKEFRFILKVLKYGFWTLLTIAIVDYTRLLPIQFYFQTEALGWVEEVEELVYGRGGIDRASLGSVCLVGIFVSLLMLRLRAVSKVACIAGIIGFIFVLFLCQSRTAYLGLATFGLFAILQRGQRLRNIALFLVACAAIYIIVSTIPFVSERVQTLLDVKTAVATGGRVEGYKRALGFWLNHPLILLGGVGYDCWQFQFLPATGLHNAHNFYLQAVGELGLIGGVIYVAFFVRLLRFFMLSKRLGGEARIIGQLSFCLLGALLLSNMTITGLYPSMTRINAVHALMFIFGFLCARLRYLFVESWEASMADEII